MYHTLTDPAWEGYRRIEQERIPLKDALAALATTSAALPRIAATLAGSERKHAVNDFSSASIAIGRCCCADQRGGDMRNVRASIPRSAFEPCRPADRNDRRDIR
jgi:hypothetical protein